MKGPKLFLAILLLAGMILPMSLTSAQGPSGQPARADDPLGTTFTYQGRLVDAGTPVDDTCSFQFGLWDDPISGTLVAGPLERTGVAVVDGRFTVPLDFGSVFDGSSYWLEVAVQCTGDPAYGTLAPRQELTAAPYALYSQAAPWSGLTGVPAGFADNVDDDVLGGLSCADGQVAKWDGAEWYCANDDRSFVVSGTNVFAGEGLYAITGTGSVTLNVFFGDSGSARSVARSDHTHAGEDIVTGTVGTAYYSAYADLEEEGYLGNAIGDLALNNGALQETLNSDLLDGKHGSEYQLQIGGACDVGSTIRAINADGTVVCEVDAPLNRSNPPVTNTISVLDSAGNVGSYPAVTIGPDGLGLISYADSTNGDLKVAHCDNVACTVATLASLDSTSGLGLSSPSVTIGSDGLPLISYVEIVIWPTDLHLKVAHCNGVACASATITTLDSAGAVGTANSVVIGADGLGLISYYDSTNQNLKVAHCSDVACTSATITVLDSAGDVGSYTSIALGTDGLGLISYCDGTNTALKVAHCSNIACTTATATTLDSAGSAGVMASITVGADGLGLISYRENSAGAGELRVAHCNDVACTGATVTTLVSSGAPAWGTVTIGSDGLGAISYTSVSSGSLMVAHCSNITCSSATITTLDSIGNAAQTAVTIGVDGLPLVSYNTSPDSDLRVAHCSNPFCVPYWRRR